MRRYDRPLIAAAICLAALAGLVDAIGFLGLGGFFLSFMSGNTTRLGVGIGSGAEPTADRAAALILAFVVGVMGGTLIAHWLPRWRKPAVLACVTLLLALASGFHVQGADQSALLLAAAAMGAENGTFQRDGEVSIGLTYMTGTLVRCAQRLALALVGGERWAWLPYLLLWLGFLWGVLAGTSLYARIGLDALWVATAAAALLTLVVGMLTRPR
jgi:uncharacterized membrane protein YoaK (UPF0700 family)